MKKFAGYMAITTVLFLASACDENRYQTIIDEDTCPISVLVETESTFPGSTRSAANQEILDADGNIFAVLTELEEPTPVEVYTDSAKTKGTLVNDLAGFRNVHGNTFTVSAYKGATAVFTNQTATYSTASKWTLSTARRWPTGDTYEFFGYTASAPTVTFSQNGSPSSASIASYTSPSAAGNQTDFLLGYYKGTGSNGAAPMHFSHPLTSVRFEFVSFPASIKIKSISLTGIKNSGSCVARFVNANGHTPTYTWTTGSNTSTFTQTFSSLAPASVSAVPFVLIPQTFAAGSTSSIQIVANYGGADRTISVRIASASAPKTWNAGITYVYRLSYSASTGIDVEDVVQNQIKRDLTITNTGTAPEYIRVALVGSWKDSNGKVVAAWDKTQGNFVQFPGTNWILGSDGFYYYTKPVLGGNGTANALFHQYVAPNVAPVAGAHLELSVIGQAVIWDENKTQVSASWKSSNGAPISSLSTTPEQ